MILQPQFAYGGHAPISGFDYYSPLTVQTGQVPSTQTDFPILINVTDARFKTVGNGGHVKDTNGYDIRPYSDALITSALTYELEFYDGTNGIVVMWVKRSSLDDGNVTYLAYGNASLVTDGSSTATWSNGFLGVYHLADGTTLNVNSATGSNNGTNHSATATAGQIDGGAAFVSASSQYVDFGTGINPSAITLSIWVKATSFPNSYQLAIAKIGVLQNYANILVKSTGKLCCATGRAPGNTVGYNGSGSNTLSTGTWYRVVMTCSAADGLKGYVNGSLDGSSSGLDPNVAGATAAIGGTGGYDENGNFNTGYWDGSLDEASFSSVIRSPDWITTDSNNQLAPGTFMVLGAEV